MTLLHDDMYVARHCSRHYSRVNRRGNTHSMRCFRFLAIALLCLMLSQICCTSQKRYAHASPGDSPSIDCPLRKQGIDLHSLKPFKEVKKYIEFLEREERALWQKPDAVVKALGLTGSETVADVGAGSGYFTFRLSKALPKGKVLAIEIEPEMVRHIHHKATSNAINNIEVVLATPDDPHVPANADLVFMCDVLHHVKNKANWLQKMYDEMKNGSRLVLIEFKEGKLPEGPPEKIKIPLRRLTTLVGNAGFTKVKEDHGLLPYQHILVFKKQ